jgi:hypothetical protein
MCSQNFTKLCEISLLDSSQLTDVSFEYLSQAKKLRKLRIASNQNLTDYSIKLIARSCIELRYVSLVDCERLGDSSLKYLSACKNLSALNLTDCIRY